MSQFVMVALWSIVVAMGHKSADGMSLHTMAMLPVVPYVERTILKDSSDFDQWSPSDQDAAAIARAGCYFSLGTEKEAELIRRSKLVNPNLEVSFVTNGCNFLESRDYHWMSLSNQMKIEDVVCQWFDNRGCRKPRRICGWMLDGYFQGRGYRVITTHYAIAYTCSSIGMPSKVLSVAALGSLNQISASDMLICSVRERDAVEQFVKINPTIPYGFVEVRDGCQIPIVELIVRLIKNLHDARDAELSNGAD